MNQDQKQAEVRETAKQIAHRLIDEPNFRDQVKKDPQTALTGAGLPAEAVPDFLREIGAQSDDEVSGYGMCTWTCSWTCSALSLQEN
ncbi:MAG: hypothetical protein ACOC9Y_03835 [Chloroflexota bacterium]